MDQLFSPTCYMSVLASHRRKTVFPGVVGHVPSMAPTPALDAILNPILRVLVADPLLCLWHDLAVRRPGEILLDDG
jgi:hypothetical protein